MAQTTTNGQGASEWEDQVNAMYWANEPGIIPQNHWFWQCHKCAHRNPMNPSAYILQATPVAKRQLCGNREVHANAEGLRVQSDDPIGRICTHQRCAECIDLDDLQLPVRFGSGALVERSWYVGWLYGFLPLLSGPEATRRDGELRAVERRRRRERDGLE